MFLGKNGLEVSLAIISSTAFAYFATTNQIYGSLAFLLITAIFINKIAKINTTTIRLVDAMLLINLLFVNTTFTLILNAITVFSVFVLRSIILWTKDMRKSVMLNKIVFLLAILSLLKNDSLMLLGDLMAMFFVVKSMPKKRSA